MIFTTVSPLFMTEKKIKHEVQIQGNDVIVIKKQKVCPDSIGKCILLYVHPFQLQTE